MKSEIQYLAELSIVDLKLDELQEDCGDLPQKIRKQEKRYNDLLKIVKETEEILNETKKFKVESKLTLQTLKEKEENLADKQFNVKNNKEFDAITKEIDHTRSETTRLTDALREAGVKEENLTNMLENQKKDAENANTELQALQAELDEISSDQNEDLQILKKKRAEIVEQISEEGYAEYTRIRHLHHDAVIPAKRNSCTGCYSMIPPQKNVELRNSEDKIFYCENCGRIIYTEELPIDQDILDII